MDVVKRSILFEIVNKGIRFSPIEAFTLIIPPETISIEEPQRISYTKTFGGVFIDDYGSDVLKITISGNTGNTELKKTFSPSDTKARVPEKLNGQDSFFYFRDKLMRYKNSITDYDKYEMIIYDLSLIPEKLRQQPKLDINFSYLTEGYVVSLDKFKMSRNKDKPLFFNYSIEMTGISKLSSYLPSIRNVVSIPEPFNIINAIRKEVNSIKSVLGKITAIKNEIESYIGLVDQIEEQLTAFYNQTIDILIYPASLCKLALKTAKNLADSIQNIGESFAADIGIAWDEYLEIISITQEMLQLNSALVTKSKQPDSYNNKQYIRTKQDSSTIESGIKRYEELTELETEIFSKVAEVNAAIENILVAYGYALVIIDATTSLEKIALEYYGDASLQEVIAFYNDLEGIEDLEIGSVLKVPVLSQFVSPPNNFVYSSFINDVFGSDIKLDENYNPVVGESGDFLTISNDLNILQALNLRLNESLGSRLRLVVYGIKGGVGQASVTSSPISYILANIKYTVLQDPRIQAIENMNIKGIGDRLYISFNSYTIKRGETIPFHNTI